MNQRPSKASSASFATASRSLAALLFVAAAGAGCSVSLEGNGQTQENGSGELPERPGDGRFDAGSEPSLPDATVATDAAPDSGCNVDGRYAIRIAFDVKWAGTSFAGIVPVISPGQGELSFIVLVDISRDSGKPLAVAQACGAKVPDFESSLSERYSARFREALWESSMMPRFELEPSYGCFEPGCEFATSPIFALLGAQLAAPSAVWPARAAGGGWPDHDNDGRPGITVNMAGAGEVDAQGRSYAHPPVAITALFTRRVNQLMLGLRIGLTLRGELVGCDALAGDAPMGSIDTRAIECIADDFPMACNADELKFLDDNLPVWTVRGGSFRGVRVDKTASCAAARAAFP